MKDWTGKTHQIDIVTADLVDGDTGCRVSGWHVVRGTIDGQSVLLDAPVSTPNLDEARRDMEDAIERYLDGQHHPTHYTGQFAYLAN